MSGGDTTEQRGGPWAHSRQRVCGRREAAVYAGAPEQSQLPGTALLAGSTVCRGWGTNWYTAWP